MFEDKKIKISTKNIEKIVAFIYNVFEIQWNDVDWNFYSYIEENIFEFIEKLVNFED